MACKEDFIKKCAAKPPTKEGNPYKATWNQTRKVCECLIEKQIKDDTGKVVDTETVRSSQTR